MKINMISEIQHLEEKYFPDEKADKIKEDFENFSRANIMSKKKLLEYYGMIELDSYKLGNLFFETFNNSYPTH